VRLYLALGSCAGFFQGLLRFLFHFNLIGGLHTPAGWGESAWGGNCGIVSSIRLATTGVFSPVELPADSFAARKRQAK
jgi:hypothetical protein